MQEDIFYELSFFCLFGIRLQFPILISVVLPGDGLTSRKIIYHDTPLQIENRLYNLAADVACLHLYGRDKPCCFHCMLCSFGSGSKWWIHVSYWSRLVLNIFLFALKRHVRNSREAQSTFGPRSVFLQPISPKVYSYRRHQTNEIDWSKTYLHSISNGLNADSSIFHNIQCTEDR